MLQLKLSVQTASLRMPLKSALQVAAEIGADAVTIDARQEFVAPVSRTAVRQLLKQLEDYRLKVAALVFQTRHGLGDSQNLERRIEAIKATLRLGYQLGTNCVVCDIGEIPSSEQDDARSQWVDVVNDLGRAAHREGAFLAARTGATSPESLASLLQDTEPGSLMVSMDPAQAILHGNSVPACLKLSQHAIHLHASDAVRDFAARKAIEVELGRGSVDWPEVMSAMEQGGFNGFITVGRNDGGQAGVECQNAIDYLRNLFRG